MAWLGGNIRSGDSLFNASLICSKENHLTSSISSSQILISVFVAMATHPIINDDGNGHDCDDTYDTDSTLMPLTKTIRFQNQLKR